MNLPITLDKALEITNKGTKSGFIMVEGAYAGDIFMSPEGKTPEVFEEISGQELLIALIATDPNQGIYVHD